MDMDLPSLYDGLRSGLAMLKDAITIAKGAKDLLPDGVDKDTIGKKLAEADRTTKIAEAQIAKTLGYQLCQCTFPPQIMLSKGYQQYSERFECSKCGKAWPPPEIPTDDYHHDCHEINRKPRLRRTGGQRSKEDIQPI